MKICTKYLHNIIKKNEVKKQKNTKGKESCFKNHRILLVKKKIWNKCQR